MISSPDHSPCPGCVQAKRVLKKEIDEGTVKVLTIDDDKGWDIIERLKLRGVPQLILEKDGKYCPITTKGEVGECIGEEKK